MGIPGLRGGDHVGITVPDMEQAHEFLVDVLGCEFVYSLPEMRHDGQRDVPRNSDLGGHHVALYVDDMDAAGAYLAAKGVRLLAGPVASRNASAGQRWRYFLAPWGMQFELVSYPGGKAYEKDAAVKLWHPGHPDQ